MILQERIELMHDLGEHIKSGDEFLEALMKRTEFNNAWLTFDNQQKALDAIVEQFLQKEILTKWANQYPIQDEVKRKKVGIVMAGNIPLVGFHDLLSVFISGHTSMIKLSEKDKFVLPYLIQLLEKKDKRASSYFEIVDRLKGFEAVIATGSNNTARYFEDYFGKYPNIIRRNRNGVAVLNGNESHEEMVALGQDIFTYFGLGCRNVSKLYLPEGFEFNPLLEALHEYKDIVRHNKYKNNFDYNYAIFLLNKVKYQANGCIIMVENEALPSSIATLHYSFYKNEDELRVELLSKQDQVQCITTQMQLGDIPSFPLGMAQSPAIDDYADGVDTLAFLSRL